MTITDFKPIASITPRTNLWENGTWKFNIPAITPIIGSSPSYQDIVVSGIGAVTLSNSLADGLNYLKLFGGTEQRNIPSGFTQVEYLESSGTQYIDTGIVLKSEATITTVGQNAQSSVGTGPYSFWGFMGDSTMPRWGWSIYQNKWLTDLNATSQNPALINTNKHIFKNTCYYNNNDLLYDSLLDGNSIFASAQSVQSPPTYTSNTLSAYLFARNNNGTASNFLNCRIFSYEIVQDGIKVLSLIPCRRNADNVLGMYDTVSGNFLTNAGTGTFTAGSDTVPTPNYPMDIWCNNGVLKLSPNLFNKNLVPDVNEYINKSNGNVSSPTSGEFRHSDYITIKENTQYYVGIITSTANTAGLAFYDDTQTYISGLSLTEIGNANNIITSPNNTKYIRFSFRTDEGYNTNWQNTVYFVEGNQPLAEFIPYGKAVIDGTVETVEITGKNLFDPSAITENKYISSVGEETSDNSYAISDYIYVAGANKITISTTDTGTYPFGGTACKAFYDANKNYISNTATPNSSITATNPATVTIPSGAVYFRTSVRKSSRNTAQVEYGDTATTFEAYTVLGTATAEMLLKVGTYQDEQSVIDGGVTRNIGVKVLDGTENYVKDGSRYYYTPQGMLNEGNKRSTNLLCSHFLASATGIEGDCFKYTGQIYFYPNMTLCPDATAFKQWLTDQYNAGTPVIIVYPLATATTESVTGQPLSIQAGTNIVEITQASMDNLSLEVSYKGEL